MYVCISYAKNVADHTNGPHIQQKEKLVKNVQRAEGLIYVKDPLTMVLYHYMILLCNSFK